MSRLPPLNALVHFEAVARLGTVAAAAKELSVSSSAVSHQIRALEQSVGVALFRRESRRLIATEDGEQLYASASEALDLLRQTRQRIERGGHRQSLSFKISQSLAFLWLMPRLGAFSQAHPEIDLTIDASPNRSDFALDATDFDIRYGNGDWEGLASELVFTDKALPVARSDHPVFSSRGDVAARLSGVELIRTGVTRLQWQDWLSHNDIKGVDVAGRLYFRTACLSIRAAEQGLGVALGETPLLLDAFRSGRLKPVFAELRPVQTPAYWFVCPSRHLHRRPVALFRTWLLEQARAHEAAIEPFLSGGPG